MCMCVCVCWVNWKQREEEETLNRGSVSCHHTVQTGHLLDLMRSLSVCIYLFQSHTHTHTHTSWFQFNLQSSCETFLLKSIKKVTKEFTQRESYVCYVLTHTRLPSTQNEGEVCSKTIGMLTPGTYLTRNAESSAIIIVYFYGYQVSHTHTRTRHMSYPSNQLFFTLSQRNNGELLQVLCF